MVAQKVETLKHGGDRVGDQDANLHLAREQAADLLNVSVRSIASAKEIRENGAPELVAAVEAGQIAVSNAEGLLKQDVDFQKAVVTKVVD